MKGRFELPTQFARAKSIDPQQYASALAWLLAPVSATGYAMALWRYAADMRWLGAFFISDGLFSRWQIWLVLAVAAQSAAHQLRRGRRPDSDPVSGS